MTLKCTAEEREKKWKELLDTPSGTILHDKTEDGLRFIIMRGPRALCAYVGIPLDHPLAGHYCEAVCVSAHGGLTFSSEGSGKYHPSGFYWYGWDYAHCGDYCFYYDPVPSQLRSRLGDKKWLVEDVEEDSWQTIYDFKKLMVLAEAIRNKAKVEGKV